MERRLLNNPPHRKAARRACRFASGLLLCALALLPVRSRGEDLGDMFFSAGTTVEDANGRHWAYLVWHATDPSALLNRSFAVYKKTGDAASANPYARIGVVSVQTEPRVIRMLLTRAANLGEDLAWLESAVDSLFQDIIPDTNLSLEEKLSEVVRGGLDETALYENIIFLARNHPAVAMALGHAFATQIAGTGKTTFEIRTYDSTADQAGEVMGRVTVEAGAPIVLPAPVSLSEITENSPKGHLNVRLRWATSDALRRLSLLNHGFNVYRMKRAYTEHGSRMYHVTPPTPAALSAAVAADTNDVALLNRQPVLIDERNAGTNDYFFIDDNDRFAANGVPLVNGDAYYYFVTARDLLGRDGLVSTGLLSTVCDRMPPRPPRNVRARNIYRYTAGAGKQEIRITWSQNVNTNDDTTLQYYVYRWRTISNMHRRASNPANNRISGAIAHVPGQDTASYVDTTLGTNDFGKTYWYTVRAEDDGAGGGNLSGNSAPAFAVLRDRTGPPKSSRGSIDITVEDISVNFISETTAARNGEKHNFRIVCDRTGSEQGVAWAEFRYLRGTYQPGSETNAVLIGRRYFRPGASTVSETIRVDKGEENNITFLCRAGSRHGKISPYDFAVVNFPPPADYREVTFAAMTTYSSEPVDSTNRVHVTEGDGSGPELDLITGVIPITLDAREWRVYRRVNFGKLTLVAQGEADGRTVTTNSFTDYGSAILNGGTLCYYYQLLDEHGNPGPLTLIACFKSTPSRPLPTPILAPIEPVGTTTNPPQMRLNWFCPPPGVVRFEVAISDASPGAPDVSSSVLSTNTAPSTNIMAVAVGDETNDLHFGVYQTGRVGANYGDSDSPDFSADVNIELRTPYTVLVRALGEGGRQSDWSAPEQFTWYVKSATETNVPWPARPLPMLQTTLFDKRFEAVFLAASNHVELTADRMGIRIGDIPATLVEGQGGTNVTLNTTTNPVAYLFKNDSDKENNVLPFVLYRYQVTNATLTRASGDVVQVSPLMENIAYQKLPTTATIKDPYILVIDAKTNSLYDIFMLDTQPVISGATYKYLLVRFDEDKEIERIIPSNEVTVP